jgi:hypothetical protein
MNSMESFDKRFQMLAQLVVEPILGDPSCVATYWRMFFHAEE